MNEQDPYSRAFEWEEAIIGWCSIEGCDWSVTLHWEDFDGSASRSRAVYTEHWDTTHANSLEAQVVALREALREAYEALKATSPYIDTAPFTPYKRAPGRLEAIARARSVLESRQAEEGGT